jgi:hypothetical protein
MGTTPPGLAFTMAGLRIVPPSSLPAASSAPPDTARPPQDHRATAWTERALQDFPSRRDRAGPRLATVRIRIRSRLPDPASPLQSSQRSSSHAKSPIRRRPPFRSIPIPSALAAVAGKFHIDLPTCGDTQ